MGNLILNWLRIMDILNKAADAIGIPVKKLMNYIMYGAVVCIMLGVG